MKEGTRGGEEILRKALKKRNPPLLGRRKEKESGIV